MEKGFRRIIAMILLIVLCSSFSLNVGATTIPFQNNEESGSVSPNDAEIPDPDLSGALNYTFFSMTANNVYSDRGTRNTTKYINEAKFPENTHKIGFSGTLSLSTTVNTSNRKILAGIAWYSDAANAYVPDYCVGITESSKYVYQVFNADIFRTGKDYYGYIRNDVGNGSGIYVTGSLSFFALYTSS